MAKKKLIIDVREPHEYLEDHVDIAINIPLSEITSGTRRLDDLDKETEIIVYCRSGGRSNMSIPHLKRMGFTNIKNGINADHVSRNYLV